MARINDDYWNAAVEIHKKHPVVDAHLDLAAEIHLRYQSGEKEVIKNHYLDNFKKGGVNLVVSSVFVVSQDLPERGLKQALNQISALLMDLKSVSDEVLLVKTKHDLETVLASDKIGIILYMEGLDPIGAEKNLLWAFYEMGVRGASLTWSRRNYFAEGCCNASDLKDIKGGLSLLGRETVALMEEIPMFLDISHLNDEGFKELASLTSKPFIATHSNARSIHMNYRNLTDEQILVLAKQNGIMGLNAYKDIVGADPSLDSVPKMCDHLEHVIHLAGDSHVGFGFDLCDSYFMAVSGHNIEIPKEDCLTSHAQIPEITAELLRRGHSEKTIAKIIGGNFLTYFHEILP